MSDPIADWDDRLKRDGEKRDADFWQGEPQRPAPGTYGTKEEPVTQALQTVSTDSQSAAVALSPEQVQLLKDTICKGATNDELALFIQVCKSKKLDPFSGQIHAVKRWANGRETMTYQTGIDGFRLLAERTGLRAGMDGPFWCGADGKWMDVWLSPDPPKAARVIVYTKGSDKGYAGTAYWDFYVQTKKSGEPNRMWAKGGPNMLAKCAEALALRMAFPSELSGVYTSDEMGQAENEPQQRVRLTRKELAIEAVKGELLAGWSTKDERADAIKRAFKLEKPEELPKLTIKELEAGIDLLKEQWLRRRGQ
jgi:phage recombination protein Bet